MMIPRRFLALLNSGVLLLLMLSACISSAQEPAPISVKVRAAKHQDSIRIVLATEDVLVKNASVILTKNKSVRIDLRSAAAAASAGREKPGIIFETDKGSAKGDAPLEIMKSVTLTARGDGCIIAIPGVEDIKVAKLQSPARLVVDAYFSAATKEQAAPAVPLKPLADQVAFKYIVVDAGHGGYDYGIRGKNFAEKDFALQFAREFAALFAKSGKEAVLTRKSDQIMTLSERIGIINKRPPDLVISFHVASTKVPVIYSMPERNDSGLEPAVRIIDQRRRETVNNICDAISAVIEKDISVKPLKESLPISLVMKSKAPAILIELPNPDEFNYDKKSRERLMAAVLKGLAAGAAKEEKPVTPAAARPEARPQGKTADKIEKM